MAGLLGFVQQGQQALAGAGPGAQVTATTSPRDANGDGFDDKTGMGTGWQGNKPGEGPGWEALFPGGWWLRQATGNFGNDDANAIAEANKGQMAFLDKALAAGQQAGQQAQAGLDPYAQAGTDALAQQRALAGLDGPEAQQAAIAQLQQSPAFLAQIQQQEQGILANASATGGLRGGNVQQALAQNRSQTLTDIINQQYAQFGGLAGAGQQAASQQGAFGLNGAGMQADILQQQGNAFAGNVIGQQQALNNGRREGINLLSQAGGTAAGAFL